MPARLLYLFIPLSLLTLFFAPPALAASATAPDTLDAQSITDLIAKSHATAIPPGIYHLSLSPRYHLTLSKLHDLTIDAAGVTFIFTDPRKGGILFDDCANVTLHGLKTQYQTPPFTQGAIQAVAPDNSWIDLKIDPGYPANMDDPAYFRPQPSGYVFDPATRAWKRGVAELWLSHFDRLAQDRFRFYSARKIPPGSAPILPGDLMAFRGIGGAGIALRHCSQMTLDALTLTSCGGFCIHEFDGPGENHYHDIHVTFGPTPSGATAPPLISSNADAFHSSDIRHGPLIDHCLFEGMPDDGIAIHGLTALVMQSAGTSLIVATTRDDPFQTGDSICLCTPQGGFADTAKIISRQDLTDYRPPGPISSLFPAPRLFHQFTLDHPVAGAFQYLLSDNDASGSGYILRDNIIRNHRARGMFVQGSNGLIQDNLIQASTLAAIVVGPEYSTSVAGYMTNLTIRHNTFRDVGYATSAPWDTRPGAVTIAGESDQTSIQPGQSHIAILDNRFENITGVNLMIQSARDISITGNIFDHPQQTPTTRGSATIDPSALIYLDYCHGVTFDNNEIIAPPPTLKPLVTTDSAQLVTGADTGINVTKTQNRKFNP